MNKTPFSTYKVRFHDCDLFGHLNNARYLDYMINARQDHLKEAYDFDYNAFYKRDLGWVVSHHEIQYLKPAFFDEIIRIQSSLLHADDDSLLVELLMMNETGTQLKAVLRSKLTFIHLKTGRKEQHEADFLSWARTLIPEGTDVTIPLNERIGWLIGELKKSA